MTNIHIILIKSFKLETCLQQVVFILLLCVGWKLHCHHNREIVKRKDKYL